MCYDKREARKLWSYINHFIILQKIVSSAFPFVLKSVALLKVMKRSTDRLSQGWDNNCRWQWRETVKQQKEEAGNLGWQLREELALTPKYHLCKKKKKHYTGNSIIMLLTIGQLLCITWPEFCRSQCGNIAYFFFFQKQNICTYIQYLQWWKRFLVMARCTSDLQLFYFWHIKMAATTNWLW